MMDLARLELWGYDGVSLFGCVYGHEDFPNGRHVRTSAVINIYRNNDKRLQADCVSRTYILGKIDPEYESQFPNAVERLIVAAKAQNRNKGNEESQPYN